MAGRCRDCSTLIDTNDNFGTTEEHLCKSCFDQRAESEEIVFEKKEAKPEKHIRKNRVKMQSQIAKQRSALWGTELLSSGSGVLGGIVLITLSLIWFIGGLMAGYIYFYPPILFLMGIFAILRSWISKGNNSNEIDPLDELLIEKGKDPDAIMSELRYSREEDE